MRLNVPRAVLLAVGVGIVVASLAILLMAFAPRANHRQQFALPTASAAPP